MELEELQNTWKKQKVSKDMNYSRSELLMLINNKMISFEEQIRVRDRREIVACLLAMIIFGVFLFLSTSVWTILGSGVIIIAAACICYKLKVAQRRTLNRKPAYDQPMKRHLKQELANVELQRRLLKTMGWWYIAPIGAGLFLFTVGSPWIFWVKIIYMVIVTILGAVIWWWNQRAIEKKFDPLIDEIEQSIAVLVE